MRFVDATLLGDALEDTKARAFVPPDISYHERIPKWLPLTADALCRDWSGLMDHWGTSVVDGNEVLISEPYGMTLESVRQVVRFCDLYDLDCVVEGYSFHYPTACLRLCFAKRPVKLRNGIPTTGR